MTDNFFLILAAILILPLVPAFLIYKFLPASDTDVSGPYKGLSLKLKGAFAGYFLLVVVATFLQWRVMGNKQEKSIENLNREAAQKDTTIAQLKSQLAAAGSPVIDWKIRDAVMPANREGTRFFYDDGATNNAPDGSFELIKRSIAKDGPAKPPKWMCVYNAATGFKVVSLNRNIQHPDIAAYNVAFDDATHEILVRKPIDINSIEKDSVVAVANFIEKNAELKLKVMQLDPAFLQKADVIKREQQLSKSKLLRFEESRRRQ